MVMNLFVELYLMELDMKNRKNKVKNLHFDSMVYLKNENLINQLLLIIILLVIDDGRRCGAL
jgi:hypothetical protein